VANIATSTPNLLQCIQEDFTDAYNERAAWNSRFNESIAYVIPRRRGVNQVAIPPSQGESGRNTVPPIIDNRADSTATYALGVASDGLCGYTVSPAYPFFKFSFKNQMLNLNKAFRGWLDSVEDVVYSALNRSNFYSINPEVVADAMSLANATSYSDELDNGTIRFIAIHPLEVYFKENEKEEIVVHWRDYMIKKSAAKKLFPERVDDFAQLSIVGNFLSLVIVSARTCTLSLSIAFTIGTNTSVIQQNIPKLFVRLILVPMAVRSLG
jgi:hypothetical protein